MTSLFLTVFATCIVLFLSRPIGGGVSGESAALEGEEGVAFLSVLFLRNRSFRKLDGSGSGSDP